MQMIAALDAERQVAIVREMTKTFEECKRGKSVDMASYFAEVERRGEIVLLIGEGKVPEEPLPLDELLRLLQELHGISLKEAIKKAAKLTDRPKSEVYKRAHTCPSKTL